MSSKLPSSFHIAGFSSDSSQKPLSLCCNWLFGNTLSLLNGTVLWGKEVSPWVLQYEAHREWQGLLPSAVSGQVTSDFPVLTHWSLLHRNELTLWGVPLLWAVHEHIKITIVLTVREEALT